MSKEDKVSNRPCILTYEGEIIGAFVDPEQILVLEGMHPYVIKQFRTKEALIRGAMRGAVYPSVS